MYFYIYARESLEFNFFYILSHQSFIEIWHTNSNVLVLQTKNGIDKQAESENVSEINKETH